MLMFHHIVEIIKEHLIIIIIVIPIHTSNLPENYPTFFRRYFFKVTVSERENKNVIINRFFKLSRRL